MGKYVFKPYDKLFVELFEREKSRVLAHTKEHLTIEHIGSTAVPGLGGKGIIDIGIVVDKAKMESVSQELQKIGYEFRPTYSTSDRFYFIIYLPDPLEETRRYHVHLTYPENQEWKNFLSFRDYLRSHPDALHEYAEIKRKTAESGVGELYRKAKDPVIKKMLDL